MFHRLPFPFAHGQFPRELGAVVQRTVLSGDEPARLSLTPTTAVGSSGMV
jgi:hypothetical protein